MAAESLIALLDSQKVGVVHREQGRLSFRYDEAWRTSLGAYPLSLSMPLAAAEHGHRPVEAFLWGLLPDNQLVLDRWARRFHVSARNPFALIGEVGEDCAGAIQFVRPDRVDALMQGGLDAIDWLDEAGVAERLRALRADQAAWRIPRDAGQFSLAGAQPKTALLLEDGRWGVPSGRAPTTHILKPPTGEFDGHAENEHFCLSLARELGVPVASSTVRWFEDQIAIVVERYDRMRVNGRLVRIHQEDFCQALAHPPAAKYENEGGPGVAASVRLLAEASSAPTEDMGVFVDAILLNWLIGGTDAHAKNYSLLLAAGGRVRLAPLYDVASALPYPELDVHRLKLAMKLGGEYNLRKIGPSHLGRLANDARQDPAALVARAAEMAERIRDIAPVVAGRIAEAGLTHPIVPRLSSAMAERADAVAGTLAGR